MRRNLLIGRCSAIAGGIMVGIFVTSPEGPANAEDTPVPGLVLPKMNPQRGRELFVGKACVVCHAINGVGGQDAAPLDASTMDPSGNPFEFFARMWLGTKPMIAIQEERIGHQVELTADELADIVAFIHDEATQKSFSEQEIPESIEHLME